MILLLIFILQSANAENWMRVEDIKAGKVRGFQLKAECEKGLKLFESIEVPCPKPPIEESSTAKMKTKADLPCFEEIKKEVCVEIGNLSSDVVKVDESGPAPVAVLDPIKKQIKDAVEQSKRDEQQKVDSAENALKALPEKPTLEELTTAVKNILIKLGIK